MTGMKTSVSRMAAAAVILVAVAVQSARADDIRIDVANVSEHTRCAEKDNVYLKLNSPSVRRFTIEAVHPAYIGTVAIDRAAPDFTNCDMSKDPSFAFEKRRQTIYETEEWQLVGLTFPSFWRPNQVPVRVGGRVETGFHLLQVWTRYQERAEEVLVLYPADGYWRARPLPPANLRWSAYGSSFMIGPIESDSRPFVDIREIVFDPATRTFTLQFSAGGSATLKLAELNQDRIVLDVDLAQPAAAERPFAALRSMFVGENNSDAAHFGWRGADPDVWIQSPIMGFTGASVSELWLGRTVPSRHNTSAPDMVFRNFSSGPR